VIGSDDDERVVAGILVSVRALREVNGDLNRPVELDDVPHRAFRINRVRPVMAPKQGMQEWEVVSRLATAMGYPMSYGSGAEIMDEIAKVTPTFAGVSFEKLDRLGSVQWPCNEKAPLGTPVMHIGGFARGKGNFMITEYVPTDERTGPRFPLLLTTGRILSQYNVGAQTRRTDNVVWHEEDVLEIHPHDAEQRGCQQRHPATSAFRQPAPARVTRAFLAGGFAIARFFCRPHHDGAPSGGGSR